MGVGVGEGLETGGEFTALPSPPQDANAMAPIRTIALDIIAIRKFSHPPIVNVIKEHGHRATDVQALIDLSGTFPIAGASKPAILMWWASLYIA